MSSPSSPSFSMFLKCLFGPRLYRIHDMAQTQGKNYQPKFLESFCDGLIKLFTFTLQMGAYTSPIILVYLLRRGNNFTNGFSDSLRNLIKFSTSFAVALLSVYCLRGIGRVKNNDYVRFISNLTLQQASSSSSTIKRRYDFDFSQWTVDFKWNESRFADEKKPPLPMMSDAKTSDALVDRMIAVPCNFVTHIIAHTVGRWMIYPGSVGILQALMAPALIDGRKLLIERRKGIRYKLLAQNNNEIDCMFIDRRDSDERFGKKLVICCEGNAGFYESGIVVTPVHTGYSTLGWNHPGFGGSSGLPFPAQEVAAIDVVVKFALDKLGFDEKDVLIMGWSIGGYTASWAAMTYPDVRGLILDATFDDIVPLALARTPSWWKPLTIGIIRGYFDLNVSRHLENYPGPVLIIRRTEDEMIITRDDEPIGTNRANNLLVKLFQNRFPVLMKDPKVCDALTSWLSGGPESQRLLTRMHWSDSDFALTLLKNYEQKKGSRLSYPIEIGDDLDAESKIKLIIFLASKHFKDFNSTHCTPLPPEMFSEPYDLLSSLRKMSNL